MTTVKLENNQLTPQQKDEYLNLLLMFMKNEVEKYGASNYEQVTFNFNEIINSNTNSKDGEDRKQFLSQNEINDNDLNIVLNFGLTHKFIACRYRWYGQIYITEDGMDRAVSIERATYKPSVSDATNITFNGPVTTTNFQAGNNNVQNISNTFYYLIDEIKKSDATEEEKNIAFGKLKEFINNPIISGIASGCAVEIIKYLSGMGI